MSDPESASIQQTMLEARRAFQSKFPVIPSAYSLDGRSFSFTCPVGADIVPGRYVRISVPDSGDLIAQVFETEVEELESSELRVDNVRDQGVGLPGVEVGEAKIRMRRSGLKGAGVILGRLGTGKAQPIRPFDNANIQAATVGEVSELFDSQSGSHAQATIGTINLPDGSVPGTIDPAGFNRHTFVCGQSGSGKTYSLGVVLEQLLLNTDLRIVVFDPNADYVRLNTLRDPAGAGELGAAYLTRVKDVHIFRCGDVEPGEHPLRIRFSNLPVDDQARALQLDPLKDRDEFHAFRQIVRGFGDRDYDLRDVRRASAEVLTTAARDVTLRLANLGVDEWSVWATPDGSALANLLNSAWRAAVLDVSRFARPIERSIVALAMLRYFWAHREERKPVLIVVDEAHNLCPAEPEDAIQHAATDLMVTIAGEGRKYGLYLILSTQRPDKIHPNVLSQCDNLMLMRMNSQADIDDLATVFSYAPPGMLARATTFRPGEALFAGKVVPSARLMRVGARLSPEGGADIPTDWITAQGSRADDH